MDRIIKTDKGIPKIDVDAKPDLPLYKQQLKELYNNPAPLAKTSRQQAKP